MAFNRDILARLEREPNDYNISGWGNPQRDMVLLIVYGKLFEAKTFEERTRASYEEMGNFEMKGIYNQCFLGWYKMPFMKLTFEKRALDQETRKLSDTEGKATLSFGDLNDEVCVGVIAVPKIALRYGSQLMISEGCNSRDTYKPTNHYILLANPFHLEPIPNETMETIDPFGYVSRNGVKASISDFSAMFFVSSKWAINQTNTPLRPSEGYLMTIKSAHKTAQRKGYQFPGGYLEKIEALPYI